MPERCGWCGTDPLYIAYHDEEWGVPQHDDRRLLEKLVLEGAQAGLSWITILRKRAAYRRAFHGFDPVKVAAMTDADLEAVLLDPGIVRNRLKVFSARKNALAFLAVQREFGSFDAFLWAFVGGRPQVNHPKALKDVPAVTPEAEALSKALKKRGFTFVGPTIMYAYMQSMGLVDDHLTTCWRKAL
ncbi:MAG: DNA-3-methyladenine glycosylase I [Geothrix sp.]|uniref:DNA-3-methyladenine glycosylase I n=1 Tax=Geothrix sp. TaxID=1962974 RepID=UPI00185B3FC4|nr:DNA-3-methyladenine glycosylase I [Geothrix sp.]NWJ39688.1 DNA-3-methyladenine glycosylase I [Geothrix sp.]WIL22293.1 MAG: DNA-3-methyladenine glycosylase I [Geothrix sp.]